MLNILSCQKYVDIREEIIALKYWLNCFTENESDDFSVGRLITLSGDLGEKWRNVSIPATASKNLGGQKPAFGLPAACKFFPIGKDFLLGNNNLL